MSQGTRPIGENDPLIGMHVDHFVVQRQLASGGMGAVYLMTHERPTIRRRAVLKVLLPEYARNAAIRQRFEREAEAASQLDHDNILKLDNFGVLPDGQLYMIVPYLDGQPLDQYLAAQGGRLSIDAVFHIVRQICGAVDFAHRKGIVHRDIKPGNIFLIETPIDPLHAKLLDFGIAKVKHASQDTDTHTGMALGTPSYMCCEQYDRANEATHSADIFAIAVVTYELLTGSLPWGIHDPGVLYFKQRTEIPVCPPEIPPEVFAVIAQSLAFDPSMRAPSALAFLRALERAHPLGRASYGELPPTQVANAVSPPDTAFGRVVTRSSGPEAFPASPLTTLSSSSGVTDVPQVASNGRLKLALAGGLLCVAAAGVAFAITMSRGASGPAQPASSSARGESPIASDATITTSVGGDASVTTPDADVVRAAGASAPPDAAASVSDSATRTPVSRTPEGFGDRASPSSSHRGSKSTASPSTAKKAAIAPATAEAGAHREPTKGGNKGSQRPSDVSGHARAGSGTLPDDTKTERPFNPDDVLE